MDCGAVEEEEGRDGGGGEEGDGEGEGRRRKEEIKKVECNLVPFKKTM